MEGEEEGKEGREEECGGGEVGGGEGRRGIGWSRRRWERRKRRWWGRRIILYPGITLDPIRRVDSETVGEPWLIDGDQIKVPTSQNGSL